jgi:hypothetical protein
MKTRNFGDVGVSFDPENIIESVALFGEEICDETALSLPHGLAFTFAQTWEKPAQPLDWYLMSYVDGSSYEIGSFDADLVTAASPEARFMASYLRAHKQAFSKVLRSNGWTKKEIKEEYIRWGNRAMRGLDGDLDANQDYAENVVGLQIEYEGSVASFTPNNIFEVFALLEDENKEYNDLHHSWGFSWTMDAKRGLHWWVSNYDNLQSFSIGEYQSARNTQFLKRFLEAHEASLLSTGRAPSYGVPFAQQYEDLLQKGKALLKGLKKA